MKVKRTFESKRGLPFGAVCSGEVKTGQILLFVRLSIDDISKNHHGDVVIFCCVNSKKWQNYYHLAKNNYHLAKFYCFLKEKC